MPGPITEPKEHADLLDGLPTDISSLCQVVQGVLIHIFWAERMGRKLSADEKEGVQLRHVARILAAFANWTTCG